MNRFEELVYGIVERRANRFTSTGRMENRARRNTRGNHEPAYRWAATTRALLARTLATASSSPLRPHFARPPRALSAYSRVTTHLFSDHTLADENTSGVTRVHDARCTHSTHASTTRRAKISFLSPRCFRAGPFSRRGGGDRVVEYRNTGNYDGEERPRNSGR